MDDWSLEYRLTIIRELAAQSFNDPRGKPDQKDLMLQIMFLCDYPSRFLEMNKGNFQAAVDRLERGGTVVELMQLPRAGER